MKVLMFGWEFPPDISGGLGTACQGITFGLMGNNVNVLFVAPRLSGNEYAGGAAFLSADKLPVRLTTEMGKHVSGLLSYLNVSSTLIAYADPVITTENTSIPQIINPSDVTQPEVNYVFSGGYGNNLMEEVFRYAYPAMEIANQHTFDIIHAHDWMTFPAAIAAARTSGKPLVVQIHATEFDRSGENINQDVYDIEKLGMEEADAVIAVSELTKRILVSRYDIPSHKVSVVHNALPDEGFTKSGRFKNPFKEKIISFISRITYQKNPETFLYAARHILDKDENFRFVMAGNGNLLHAMIEKAAQLGISSKVHFPGFLNYTGLSDLFSITDVYVMPSISEPFGISPLEAVKAGVPVVISRQSGVQEVLRHALKVDWWNVSELAEAIYGMAKYRSLSPVLTKGAPKDVADLKWSNQAEKIKDIYCSVIRSY